MPDQYTNPSIRPCTGTYTWVPSVSPNFGGVNPTLGFYNMVIDRGAFRNYSVPKSATPNIVVTLFGNSYTGEPYAPVINATRPLALSFPTVKSNNNNIVITADKNKNLIEFKFPTSDSSRPLSCIQFLYDLSFYVNDLTLDKYQLSSIQSGALAAMRSGQITNSNISDFVNGLTPDVIQIIGVSSSGEETILANGLNLTRVRTVDDEQGDQYSNGGTNPATSPSFASFKIKTGDSEIDRADYPVFSKIILRVLDGFSPSSLRLILKKIMFFTADRVNFRFDVNEKQLPCSALSYSMYINGTFFPGVGYASVLSSAGGFLAGSGGTDISGVMVWPQDGGITNFNTHVKLFNPDYPTNSPGFAHSLNFHLLILSFPIFGPLADFFLPGIAMPYYGVIVGPTPFTQQFIFYGTSAGGTDTLAPMSVTSFKQNTGTVTLIDGGAQTGIEKRVYNYKSGLDFLVKNQMYYESPGIGTSGVFKNLFIDEFGIQSISEQYTGSIPRLKPLLATESSKVARNVTKKSYSYSSYLFKAKPSLYELFSNSDPCLVFKCSSDTGFTSSVFQEPGFITAAIKCYVKDRAKMFGTKIAYRIYAIPYNSDSVDPNSVFSKKHTLKITDSGLPTSAIEFTVFDNSWDFSNVIVSGNITDELSQVVAEEIINSTQKVFTIADGSAYELCCAIYAFSEIDDSVSNKYDFSSYSSLDFPTITFNIYNDFSLVMPLYYLKSYKNGGGLQAMKDFGYTGKYTEDKTVYVVFDKYFNGTPYDPATPYEAQLSPTSGYTELLMMSDEALGDKTSLSIFVPSGDKKAPSENFTDYYLNTQSSSDAKISDGKWTVEINMNGEGPASVEYKFEVILINAKDFTFIMKVLESPYQPLKDNSIKVDINVPFYLPPSETVMVFRLHTRNFGSETLLNILSVKLTENTLQYFSYNPAPAQSAPLGFYEDLPIQPPSFVGNCSEFLLYMDLPEAGFFIYDPLKGIYVNGAIYSPTWQVALPENMELNYRGIINDSLFPRATGQQPYKIFFRTGKGNSVKVLDTKRHTPTGLIVTMVNTSTNTSDNAVIQIVSESFFRFFRYKTLLTTAYDSGNVVEVDLQNPTMARAEELLIQGQQIDSEKTRTILMNLETPGYYAIQPTDTGTLLPINVEDSVKYKIKNAIFTAFDYKDFKTYTVGVTENGNLIYSEDQFSTTAQATNFLLVEGKPDANSNLIQNGDYVGPVAVRYPGVLCTDEGVVVFYVLAKTPSTIWARVITAGGTTTPIMLFDFADFVATNGGTASYTFPSIDQISICKHDIYPSGNEFYIAFDCNRKVFMLKGIYRQRNFFISSVAIIYGNLGVSNDINDQNFIKDINTLVNNSSIYRLSYTSDTGIFNKNLESSQKVGFVDFDGKYLGIQFVSGNDINEVVFDKSYVINGELRTIGNL